MTKKKELKARIEILEECLKSSKSAVKLLEELYASQGKRAAQAEAGLYHTRQSHAQLARTMKRVIGIEIWPDFKLQWPDFRGTAVDGMCRLLEEKAEELKRPIYEMQPAPEEEKYTWATHPGL